MFLYLICRPSVGPWQQCAGRMWQPNACSITTSFSTEPLHDVYNKWTERVAWHLKQYFGCKDRQKMSALITPFTRIPPPVDAHISWVNYGNSHSPDHSEIITTRTSHVIILTTVFIARMWPKYDKPAGHRVTSGQTAPSPSFYSGLILTLHWRDYDYDYDDSKMKLWFGP